MQISVLTINRYPNPNYLSQTLEGLAGYVFTIFLGNGNLSHIPPGHHVVMPSLDDIFKLQAYPSPTQRHAFNMHRILCSSDDSLLFLEDDILLTDDFFFHLPNLIEQAQGEHGERFVLNLFDSRVQKRGVPDLETEPSGGFGTPAVYFGSKARTLLREHSYGHYVECRQTNCGLDIFLRREAYAQGIPMLRPSTRIISHIGHVSTGCQGIEKQVR